MRHATLVAAVALIVVSAGSVPPAAAPARDS
jgi:hypothetical protein